MNQIYYSKEILELLHKQFDNISLETWHRILNPMCGQCLYERGKALVEGRASWRPERMEEETDVR